jgi:hypothetical protein
LGIPIPSIFAKTIDNPIKTAAPTHLIGPSIGAAGDRIKIAAVKHNHFTIFVNINPPIRTIYVDT